MKQLLDTKGKFERYMKFYDSLLHILSYKVRY